MDGIDKKAKARPSLGLGEVLGQEQNRVKSKSKSKPKPRMNGSL